MTVIPAIAFITLAIIVARIFENRKLTESGTVDPETAKWQALSEAKIAAHLERCKFIERRCADGIPANVWGEWLESEMPYPHCVTITTKEIGGSAGQFGNLFGYAMVIIQGEVVPPILAWLDENLTGSYEWRCHPVFGDCASDFKTKFRASFENVEDAALFRLKWS